jgi:hypothetical protein
MSRQVTEIALQVYQALARAPDSPLSGLCLEHKICWPGQDNNLLPIADISGQVDTGEVLIVEIDDHADPARSVVKYWPWLHAIDMEEFPHAAIAFVEVSRPDDTFGSGYQLLAQFIGERFTELYPKRFRFRYLDLGGRDPHAIAEAILAFLREGDDLSGP